MPSQDFQDFKRSCFPSNFGEWHDGLNYRALLNLKDEELIEAEKLILNGIPKTWSTNHTIISAGILRLQSASAELKRQLKITRIKRIIELIIFFPLYIFRYEKHHERITNIAWSLHQIENYPDSLKIIISEIENSRPLTNNPPSFYQMEALELLMSFGDNPETIKYLRKCLTDKRFAYTAMYTLEAIEAGYTMFYQTYSDVTHQIHEKTKSKLINLEPFEWIERK